MHLVERQIPFAALQRPATGIQARQRPRDRFPRRGWKRLAPPPALPTNTYPTRRSNQCSVGSYRFLEEAYKCLYRWNKELGCSYAACTALRRCDQSRPKSLDAPAEPLIRMQTALFCRPSRNTEAFRPGGRALDEGVSLEHPIWHKRTYR